MKRRKDREFILASGLGFLLAGCGLGAPGGFVLTSTGYHSVTVLPQHSSGHDIILSKGSHTQVIVDTKHITVPSANITHLDGSAIHKTWWVPLLTVPTVEGMKLTLQGYASLQLPITWSNGHTHWNETIQTTRIQFPQQIPSKTTHGGQITLAVEVQGTIIHGTSTTAGRQTLVLTKADVGSLRWQGLKPTTPVSRQDVIKQTIGAQAGWMAGTGGSLGWFTQSPTWTAMSSVPFRANTRYRESIVPGFQNNHDNIIMYDRHSKRHYWYITKFAGLSWLPGVN